LSVIECALTIMILCLLEIMLMTKFYKK